MSTSWKKRSALLSGLCLMLTACGGGEAEVNDAASASTDEIVGGTITSGYAGVGMLVNFWENNDNNYGICTGTLVGPHTVLTAAHCVVAISGSGVERVAKASPSNLVFYTGWNSSSFDRSKVFTVADVVLPGGDRFPLASFVAGIARGAINNNDLAIVHLKNVPPITPIKISHSAPHRGWLVMMVGYGSAKKANGAGVGTKRSVKAPVGYIPNRYLMKAGTLTKGICSGDSGGPALRNGVVVGITQAAMVNGANDCVGSDYFVRADAWATFISQNIR